MTIAPPIARAHDSAPPAAPPRRRYAALPALLPGVLTAALAFRAGGFFAFETGAAALVVCLGLVLQLTGALRPFAGWSRAASVAALAGAGLVSWILLSSAWSGSAERAMTEFDRALLYVGVMVLTALAGRRVRSLTVLLRWVLLALVAACVAGLASRLFPDAFPIAPTWFPARLGFPVTYWNAMGMVAALATVLAVHHASGAQEPPWVRIAATAALPLTATTLYFTFSRGAIAAGIAGIVLYVLLGPTRRLLFTAAAAAPPVAAALIAAWHADALATARFDAGAGPGQGHHVAAVVAVAVLLAAILRPALARLERRVLAAPPPRPRRETVAVAGAAALLVAAIVVIAAGLPARVAGEARTFAQGSFVEETGDARDRLTHIDANGRIAFWRASLQAFADEPLHGTGAGTFRLTWQERRQSTYKLNDGHSLYLETLGELGVVGALLLAVLLLTPVAVALRRLRGRERHAHAAFLAAGGALLLHAGVDWDWEMPVLFCWWFGAAGMVLARSPDAAAPGLRAGSLGRLVAGLACLLLAITPVRVALSQSRLDAASAAFADGDCGTAVDSALAASEMLPRAGAFELIGFCDLRGGRPGLAVEAMRNAREHDPHNWQYAYDDALALAFAGRDPRPAARTALRRNPRSPDAIALARAMAFPDPAKRYRAAAEAPLPTD